MSVVRSPRRRVPVALLAASLAIVLTGAVHAGAPARAPRRAASPARRHAAERLPKVGDYVEVDEQPVPIRKVQPVYSETARATGVQGRVWVQALVGRDGRVLDARVLRPASPLIDPAALAAIRQWTFRPARLRGRPVACWIKVPMSFTLD